MYIHGILTLFSKTTGNSLATDTIVRQKQKAHLNEDTCPFLLYDGLGSLCLHLDKIINSAFY